MSQRPSTSCRWRLASAVLAGIAVWGAKGIEPAAALELESPSVGARLGYLFFGHSRSLAFEHRFKPTLRLDVLLPMTAGFSWGGALSGVLTTDRNYGLWSAQLRGRYQTAWGGAHLAANLGLGVGHNAPILYSDLNASASVIPVLAFGLDSQWFVSERMSLGVELETEQFATVSLGGLVRLSL